MRYKLVDERPKTFVLVFETNDELSPGLKNFAFEQNRASASFKAIGALSSAKVQLGNDYANCQFCHRILPSCSGLSAG